MACGLALCAVPARAQESRAEQIASQQEEKAGHLAPPERSRAEQLFLRATRGLVQTPEGVYPYIDSVYGGGGFTLGAGYRRFSGDNTLWDLRGLYSIKQYKLIELSTTSRDHWGGRLDVRGLVGWRDATQVGYWGLGMATLEDDRANFRFQQTYAAADLRARPRPWAVLDAGLAYEDYRTREGQGDYPSIGDRFTPVTAPGLGADPSFWRARAAAAIDTRPAEDYARHGSLCRLTYNSYLDPGDTYSFDRLDAEAVQHVPILRETWVLSLRARLQTVLDDDDTVPYFLMPALGSGSTLRGFSSWRFRDRHALLLQGEWRWFPNRYVLDVALFYDAGKVVSRRNQLDLDGLATNFGVGIRFHTGVATPLRVEIAHSDEADWKLVFAGSATF